jgi:VIT1/CCC1 family predicted Fe2+/Mn2+ transporter
VTRRHAALIGAGIFGALDGADSIIGIINGVPAGHMVMACLGGAVSSGMSMGAFSWLGGEARTNAAVTGVATAVGTLLPSLPYLWLHGSAAVAGVGVVMLLLGAVVSVAHTRMPAEDTAGPERLRTAAAKTYGALALVCAAVALCAMATGGGG